MRGGQRGRQREAETDRRGVWGQSPRQQFPGSGPRVEGCWLRWCTVISCEGLAISWYRLAIGQRHRCRGQASERAEGGLQMAERRGLQLAGLVGRWVGGEVAGRLRIVRLRPPVSPRQPPVRNGGMSPLSTAPLVFVLGSGHILRSRACTGTRVPAGRGPTDRMRGGVGGSDMETYTWTCTCVSIGTGRRGQTQRQRGQARGVGGMEGGERAPEPEPEPEPNGRVTEPDGQGVDVGGGGGGGGTGTEALRLC